MKRSAQIHKSKGFTIIELLIATLVFSTVLLVVTIGIIQISRVYYKGINETDVQNTARSIMDTVTQGIQFSGADITETASPQPGNLQAFCIGNTQYSYRLGYQLVDSSPTGNQTITGLVSKNISACQSAAATAGGKEFLSPKMRLSNLSVKELVPGSLYKVTVRVAFGDDDLLNNPTSQNASCKTTTGSQFCSVSELTSTVYRRVGTD
ncbi:MAG TPA: prepilin-type N-terminal cleavage/methylation domain-containing protein [Candidatus Saccharimonadales bacterium]|nr:prepilin-type N-terminal cleavage/methylation domain-containing protein [Candidatus Saccharimonadales bacterium]